MIVFNLTLRQLVSGKRWLALCALAALPVLISALDMLSSSETVFLQSALPDVVAGVIVPIIPLLLAGASFAADIEEGTAVYVLAKPVSRARILLERYAATALVALALTLASALISIFIQRSNIQNFSTLLSAYTAAIFVGTIVYTALFLALTLITRRGIIIGLGYILVWETMLAGQFAGTRSLSVKEYMASIASSIDRSGYAQNVSTVTMSTALTMAVLIAVLALALAWRRLRNFEVAEQV